MEASKTKLSKIGNFNELRTQIMPFKNSLCFNNVIQIATPIVDAPIKPFSTAVLYSTSHVRCNCLNFLSYYFLEGFDSLRVMFLYVGLEIALEKNLSLKSGERGGNPLLPRKEVTCPGNTFLAMLC